MTPNETSGNGKRSKFSSSLAQLFWKFLKSFKVCRRLKKIAEQRSRVPPSAKKSVAPGCQSSDGWMFKKTVKWSVGEGWRHSVTTRKA